LIDLVAGRAANGGHNGISWTKALGRALDISLHYTQGEHVWQEKVTLEGPWIKQESMPQ
jgi:hypothetical protein